MSIDASKVVHICPICDEQFSSHRKVQQHVTHTEDEQHQGINGFDMSMTIVTDTKDAWDVESEKALHEKILKSSEYFDDITLDEIREVAERAEVHISRVVRVFEDEGIEFFMEGEKPKTHPDQLTGKQKAVLEEWRGKDDARSYRSIGEEVNRKNQDITVSLSYPCHVIPKYGWMKLPIYEGTELQKHHTDGGDVTVENNTDELVESTSVFLESSDEDSDSGVITEEDVYEAFLDSDVEFTVVPDEEDFDVMSKLIKSGHDDIARHIFE